MRWFLVCLWLLLLAIPAAGQARRKAEKRLDSLRAVLEDKRQRHDELGTSEGDLLGKLQELEETIDLNASLVRRLNEREKRVTGEIRLADSLLIVRESSLVAIQGHYQERLTAISRSLIERPPAWLFFLSDPGSAVMLQPLLKSIGKADRWLISTYDSLRQDVELSRTVLTSRKDELRRLSRQKLQETNFLASSRGKRNTQLRQIRSEKTQLADAMQEMVEAANRLESLIKDLLESGAASYGGDGRHVKRARGRLPWPVRGKIIQGYGYREVGPKRARVPHRGLSIRARLGTPVLAIADGAVAHTGRLRGYGKIVLVDHGGGYFSMYAHLDEIQSFVGQIILQGDPVGSVGDSGSLEGTQLYFELRVNRVQVDPIPWLRH